MKELNSFEKELLTAWEEVYKKGQLTLWVFLALKDSPKHMAAIKTFIEEVTNNTFHVEDQSLYRSLRRYTDTQLIDFTDTPGDKGPDRKEYALTAMGEKVLKEFLERNITQVFFSENIRKLIQQ